MRGKSWLTFNRAINAGKDSLNEWISNTDGEVISDFILRMNQNNKSSKNATSDLKSRKKLKELLVDYEILERGKIKYKGLTLGIRSSVAREYSTRMKCWTFNHLELYTFDYTILIGYNDKETYYWLLDRNEIIRSSPPNTNTQEVNHRKTFSIGIPVSKGSINWIKYEKYLINKNDLKYILDRNI